MSNVVIKPNIGVWDFKKIIDSKAFYVDKTYFIKEWYDSGSEVTLLTRPRRFGKTLTMSMMEYFLSNKYKENRYLFDGLIISKYDDIMAMQGEYPVINISFAGIKAITYKDIYESIMAKIRDIYSINRFLLEEDCLGEEEKDYFTRILQNKGDYTDNVTSLMKLSFFLEMYTGKKVFIFLDEYDTPMQQAYVCGSFDDLVGFVTSLFENTFKINESLNRAIITGITRVAKENLFSGLNNLSVITTTSGQYASCFGFTEDEVVKALEICDLKDRFDEVKEYYDGFLFGDDVRGKYEIYNPWSVVNFLQHRKIEAYWVNTSSNALISEVVMKASKDVKKKFEQLLRKDAVTVNLDEETVFANLDNRPDAIWGLMVCAGYLKICDVKRARTRKQAVVKITNGETMDMFMDMVSDWFADDRTHYNDFIIAMLNGKANKMQTNLNRFALDMFSFFDSGKKVSEYTEPERFYHGFVLGLLVDLKDRFEVLSNRESGLGRYDIMLKPLDVSSDVGVIIEFKVFDADENENTLDDTVDNALKQIDEMKYEITLKNAGVSRIYKYGIGFEGKVCQIKKG